MTPMNREAAIATGELLHQIARAIIDGRLQPVLGERTVELFVTPDESQVERLKVDLRFMPKQG